MRILLALVVVAAAAAAPSKPTKNFPKKYDPEVHGVKDAAAPIHHAPDEDFLMPVFSPFGVLLPPIVPDLPPVGDSSSYSDIGTAAGKDSLVPPPEDTYSSVTGEGHSALVPPPAVPAPEDPSSYLSYEEPSEKSSSSYARTPSDASGTEVLASLAAMIQALPHISSYTSYDASAPEARAVDDGPARHLLPPPSSYSSYANVPSQQPPAPETPVRLPLAALVPPQ